MLGILPLAPHHVSLQYIHHVHLIQWGQNWGVTPPLQNRINTLVRLEEEREKFKNELYQHQQLIKIWFDENSSIDRHFHVWDLVLKWEKQNKDKNDYTKFQCFWLGPFTVIKHLGPIIV